VGYPHSRSRGCPGTSFWSISASICVRVRVRWCRHGQDRGAGLERGGWAAGTPPSPGRGWSYSSGHFPLSSWALDGGSTPFRPSLTSLTWQFSWVVLTWGPSLSLRPPSLVSSRSPSFLWVLTASLHRCWRWRSRRRR